MINLIKEHTFVTCSFYKKEIAHLENIFKHSHLILNESSLKVSNKKFVFFVQNLSLDFVSTIHDFLLVCKGFGLKINEIIRLISYLNSNKNVVFINSQIVVKLKPLVYDILDYLKVHKVSINTLKLFIKFRFKSGFKKIRDSKCNFELLSLLKIIHLKDSKILSNIVQGKFLVKKKPVINKSVIANNAKVTFMNSNNNSLVKKFIIKKNAYLDECIYDYYKNRIIPLFKDKSIYLQDSGLTSLVKLYVLNFTQSIFYVQIKVEAFLSGKVFGSKANYNYYFVDEMNNSYVDIIYELKNSYDNCKVLYNLKKKVINYNKLHNFLNDNYTQKNIFFKNVLTFLNSWDNHVCILIEKFFEYFVAYIKACIKEMPKKTNNNLNYKKFFVHLHNNKNLKNYYTTTKNFLLNELDFCKGNLNHLEYFLSLHFSYSYYDMESFLQNLISYYQHVIKLLNTFLLFLEQQKL